MEINDIPNFKLYWLGWSSSIYDLARQGWNFYTDVDHYRNIYNIALQNNLYNIIGIIQGLDMNLIDMLRNNNARGIYNYNENDHYFPKLPVNYLNFKHAIQIVSMSESAYRFSKVDKVYSMPYKDSCINLSDLIPENKEQETRIIVPEYTIPELMRMIKERQKPVQDEIRKAQRKEQHVEKPVAQIISIA